ncbi:Re/Si-specific NAD(P)(+) transhydrogenase subunit alpha [Roseivirga sp. UBA838]|uniref:Re/Si-specific NAD(P)(+) transhydrogenase subunit alpha n=1 Tax=Roseivirga sp. UBA838 TaxID=1947393 RepID=UPI00257D5E8A|nr:Re/Si-specific NAD(P)(+) transhydrogenase subunit alpha [Roseivirga sp. UBA838]|tara:strand:- start:5511 stop:6647 length:1137 start_codon:yes stop_codon:yes gene_type:complete
MIIGLLKEPSGENRVALLPENVKTLIALNVELIVESQAGTAAFTTDSEFEKAGAKIGQRRDVLSADLVLGINPPTDPELEDLKAGQVLMSVFQPLSNKQLVEKLMSLQITSFSMDNVPRTTRAQSMDVLSSMATVAGYKAVLLAASNSPRFFPMFMTAAGSIIPSKVLVLGAGIAGLQAIATARRLGAVVEAFDVRTAAEEEVKSLGAKFVKVEGATDDKSAGGYAVEQSEEYKAKQQALIQEHAAKANIIICTAQIPGRKAPVLITKETVGNMAEGSVIVDLAASTGGNCELTENDRVVQKHGVTIIGNSNLASTMPLDASKMYGKNMVNFLKLLIDAEGNLNLNWEDDILANTCVTHAGEVMSSRVKNILFQTETA